MRESEGGQERFRRTNDRINYRTAQAVEEIIANDTGAGVVAAGSYEIMVEAKETNGGARRRGGHGALGS